MSSIESRFVQDRKRTFRSCEFGPFSKRFSRGAVEGLPQRPTSRSIRRTDTGMNLEPLSQECLTGSEDEITSV